MHCLPTVGFLQHNMQQLIHCMMIQVQFHLSPHLTLKLIRSPGLSCSQLLSLLPLPLHALVLHALHPSIDCDQSLHLCQLDQASLGLAIAATATLTHLTDFSFQNQLLSWHSSILRPLLTSLPCLTSLSLKDTGLHGDFAPELTLLSNLQQLEVLDLSHNSLHNCFTALSDVLPHLPRLRHLKLAKTASFTSDLRPVADAVRRLPSLTTFAIGGVDMFRQHQLSRFSDIHLREALLAIIDSLRGATALCDLEVVFSRVRLSHTQLAHLSRALGHLTALRRLRVSTSGLAHSDKRCRAAGSSADAALPCALACLQHLTVLDVGLDAQLYGGVGVLFGALSGMSGLQELRLRGATVHDDAEARRFAAACAALSRLSLMELTRGGSATASTATMLGLVARLVQLPSMSVLRAPLVLGTGPCCGGAVGAIAAAMPRCRVRLDAVFVAGGEAGPLARSHLAALNQILPAVAALSIGGPGFAGSAAHPVRVLAENLSMVPLLTSLTMRLCTDGAVSLLQLMRGCSCLRQLQALQVEVCEGIAGEAEPQESSEGMAEAVSRLQELTKLSLSGGPGLDGNVVMAGCATLPKLRSMCLQWQRRRAEVLHVAELPSLHTLQLRNAELADEERFRKEIACLPCLRGLCLTSCSPAWARVAVNGPVQKYMPHLQLLDFQC